MRLEDSTGGGYGAKIDSNNRVHTKSVVHFSNSEAAESGRAFLIGTGPVNLTSANESAIFHIKNNEDSDLEITNIGFSSTTMTGATETMYLVKLYKSGTGLSASTAGAASNNNFSSATTLAADIEIGQEAATITNATLAGSIYIPSKTFTLFPLYWVVPKGASFEISVTPAASNTSANFNVYIDAYLSDD